MAWLANSRDPASNVEGMVMPASLPDWLIMVDCWPGLRLMAVISCCKLAEKTEIIIAPSMATARRAAILATALLTPEAAPE